jgi:hypothetical protein
MRPRFPLAQRLLHYHSQLALSGDVYSVVPLRDTLSEIYGSIMGDDITLKGFTFIIGIPSPSATIATTGPRNLCVRRMLRFVKGN